MCVEVHQPCFSIDLVTNYIRSLLAQARATAWLKSQWPVSAGSVCIAIIKAMKRV